MDAYKALTESFLGGSKSSKTLMHRNTEEATPLWKSNTPDSQDYEDVENVVWRKHQVCRYFSERGRFWTSDRKRTALKWLVTFIIGVLVGLVGLAVTYFTEELIVHKLNTVLDLTDDGQWAAGYFTMITWTFFFVLFANACVLWEPLAAGSGIPEVKCYLNGINLNKVVRIKTFLGKALGMIFSVASGLPTGKEGPMVHCGAIIAAGVSQGKSSTWGFDTSWSRFQDFRNDRAKRDFVSCGAAAGVCAAFRAPIGGVLFSLEEGSSFWSTDLTWRSFFCAMMTLLTIYVIRTAQSSLGQPDETSMFNFGEFYTLKNGTGNYSVWELFLFMIIGGMGGILGALFIHLSTKIQIFRRGFAQNSKLRFLELLATAVLMATACFTLPLIWKQCNDKPVDVSTFTSQERELVLELVRYNCPVDKFNELASLTLAAPDVAVRQLFHFREDGDLNNPTFSNVSLLLYFLIYWILSVYTNGLACTTGLFVPSLTAGALLGRLIGHILHEISPHTFADSGTYALIGAAALMGGTSRTTISLSVMLLEATGDMQYVLPLMLTLLAARYVGNFLSKGIYDVAIELKHLPYIEPSLGGHYGLLRYVPIAEIMTSPVRVFRSIESAGSIYHTLISCSHNAFPIVDQDARVLGIIPRKTLCSILKERAFVITPSEEVTDATELLQEDESSVTLGYDSMERMYPRYPHIADIQLTEEEKGFACDLRAYMDGSPYIVHESTSVQRSFRLFRSLGLRHLIVVDLEHHAKGIVTRKELTEHRLEKLQISGRDMKKNMYIKPLSLEMVSHLDEWDDISPVSNGKQDRS